MNETPSNRFDTWLIIGLGLIQGLALAALNDAAIAMKLQGHPWLLLSLWGWVLFLPPTAQWLIAYRRRRGYWLLLAAVTLAIPAICWEPARIALPDSDIPQALILVFGGALAWGAMISLASAGFQSGGLRDYPTLFRATCRTLLLPAGALLFALLFSLLLWLWNSLFHLIGITSFQRLFQNDWFMRPMIGTAFAIATAILIDRAALVDGVRRAGTAIAAALLPVIVIIHLIFLGGLATVGLEPLWGTRHATPLVLTLLITFLVLLNGAHEDGTRLDCLPRIVASAIRLAILLSPVYVAIAGYSLWLRVAQYGWSPDRLISACIITFVGLLVLAYGVQAVRRPFVTFPRFAWANGTALVLLAILGVAVNSPLLSPSRITAASQEQRIRSSGQTPSSQDWDQLAFGLGRYGRDALGRLAESAADGEIRNKAATILALKKEDRRLDFRVGELSAKNFIVVPGNRPPPPDLIEEFRTKLNYALPYPDRCSEGCKLLAVDLNKDGEPELVLLRSNLPVFQRQNRRWAEVGHLVNATTGAPFQPRETSAIVARLGEDSARLLPSNWQDVEIGGQRLRLK